MESYKLFLDQKPKDGKFQRVHAVLVTRDGRVLLRYKNGEVRPTTGGHIDDGDANMEAALRREVLEEINCETDKVEYLGYLEVEMEECCDEVGLDCEIGRRKENWARMVARVSAILPPEPDPDRENNWIYGRVLMPIKEARKETAKTAPLGNTVELVDYAYDTAKKNGYFDVAQSEKIEVLNKESKDN